jgi:hypothetical protein
MAVFALLPRLSYLGASDFLPSFECRTVGSCLPFPVPALAQAVPSLAPPRVYQSPRGAGARLAGPDKLFFGDLILQKSVLGPVLPRP